MQYAHDRIQKVYQRYHRYMEDTTFIDIHSHKCRPQENFRMDLALHDLNMLVIEISYLSKRGYFTSLEQRNYSNVLSVIAHIAKFMNDGDLIPDIDILDKMTERRQ